MTTIDRFSGESDQTGARVAEIASSYQPPITPRQLYHRLRHEGLLPRANDYQRLLGMTGTDSVPVVSAQPVLQTPSWLRPDEFARDVSSRYRVNGAEGQPVQLWIGAEKTVLANHIQASVGDYWGIPVVVTRGFTAHEYTQMVRQVRRDGRPAVLLWVADFGPSRADTLRSFVDKTHCWATVERVAVVSDVDLYGFPWEPDGLLDARGSSFDSDELGYWEHWAHLQPPGLQNDIPVEVEALDPEMLQKLLNNAIDLWYDEDLLEQVRRQELQERKELAARMGVVDPPGTSEAPGE